MITLNLPNQQQQIIQQACQVVGMDMDSFIIRQAYDNAVRILTPKLNLATTAPVVKTVDDSVNSRQQNEELAFNKALQAMPVIEGFDDKEIFMRVNSNARQIDWSE